MKNQLLLLEDLANVGRKGDLVKVKPGFARNYLIPQKKAIIADRSVIKIQARLKEERSKQAIQDKKEAEETKAKLEHLLITHIVKVDPDGHMYGSVSAKHIVDLLAQEGIEISRRMVSIDQSIKKIGIYTVQLKLKEGVEAHFNLKIEPDSESGLRIREAEKRVEEPEIKLPEEPPEDE